MTQISSSSRSLRLGAPVPGTAARLQLVDLIFTHFERKEEVEDLTSKLENDLLRIQRILDAVTADSLLIMNESFSSTTVSDEIPEKSSTFRVNTGSSLAFAVASKSAS